MRRLTGAGAPFVCVTLAQTRGSVPQEIGAKMLVTSNGRICGTVGGGRLEEAAIQQAQKMLSGPSPSPCQLVEWNLQKDIGMTCGGVVTLLFEAFHHNPWHVAIFGAGHVAQALVGLLGTLDCRIWVFDNRQEFLSQLPATANLTTHVFHDPGEAVRIIPDGAFVAIMTHGHRTDKPILEYILRNRDFPYLGVIGSASKAAVLRRELREAGVPEERLKFRCPIGLPLGRDVPEEIAVSIVAEMLQIRDQEHSAFAEKRDE